jgi:hypothetical protein
LCLLAPCCFPRSRSDLDEKDSEKDGEEECQEEACQEQGEEVREEQGAERRQATIVANSR